jgi:hypothetical protein
VLLDLGRWADGDDRRHPARPPEHRVRRRKSGVLEWREKANSAIKGEAVLAVRPKDIGTPDSTGLVRNPVTRPSTAVG